MFKRHLAVLFFMAASPAQADWIESLLDERCAAEDIQNISDEIRDAIEASVRRAEATIQAPIAVGDLSCLEDLMKQPLATFSGLGNIAGQLQDGFQNFEFEIDIDIAGMICDFAAEKWAELTEGLGEIEATIQQFADTPAQLADRLQNGGGFGSGSSSSNSTGRLTTSFQGNSQMSNDQEQQPDRWAPDEEFYTSENPEPQNNTSNNFDNSAPNNSTGGISSTPSNQGGQTVEQRNAVLNKGITPGNGGDIDYSDPNQNPSNQNPDQIYYGYDADRNFVMFKRDPQTGEVIRQEDPRFRTNGQNMDQSQDNFPASRPPSTQTPQTALATKYGGICNVCICIL